MSPSNTVAQQLDIIFKSWIDDLNLEKGAILIDSTDLFKLFRAFADERKMHVTETQFGRRMGKLFYKKQCSKTLKQQYMVNAPYLALEVRSKK